MCARVVFLGEKQNRTVEVKQLSDLATEREIHEFFSFSGEIEHIEIRRQPPQSGTAFVTFKDPKALEIALLLSVNPSVLLLLLILFYILVVDNSMEQAIIDGSYFGSEFE